MIEKFGIDNRGYGDEVNEAVTEHKEDGIGVGSDKIKPTGEDIKMISETGEDHAYWLREGDELAAPSIYRAAGENNERTGENPDSEGKYTCFWGGRKGYAMAEGHLSIAEASRLCRLSGFTNWQRREVLPAEDERE